MNKPVYPPSKYPLIKGIIRKIHYHLIAESIIKPFPLRFENTYSYHEYNHMDGVTLKINIALNQPLRVKHEGTLSQKMIQRYCHEVGHAMHFEMNPQHAMTMGGIGQFQVEFLQSFGLVADDLQKAHEMTISERIAENLGQTVWRQLLEDMPELKEI